MLTITTRPLTKAEREKHDPLVVARVMRWQAGRNFRARLKVTVFLILCAVGIGCLVYVIRPRAKAVWPVILAIPLIYAIPTALVFLTSAALRVLRPLRPNLDREQARQRGVVEIYHVCADRAWCILDFDEEVPSYLLRVEPDRFVFLHTQQLWDGLVTGDEEHVTDCMTIERLVDWSILSLRREGFRLTATDVSLAEPLTGPQRITDPIEEARFERLRQHDLVVLESRDLPDCIRDAVEGEGRTDVNT